MPKSLRRAKTDRGLNFCFSYNSGKGCNLCQPGESCSKGAHFCILCPRDAVHSATIHYDAASGTYKTH